MLASLFHFPVSTPRSRRDYGSLDATSGYTGTGTFSPSRCHRVDSVLLNRSNQGAFICSTCIHTLPNLACCPLFRPESHPTSQQSLAALTAARRSELPNIVRSALAGLESRYPASLSRAASHRSLPVCADCIAALLGSDHSGNSFCSSSVRFYRERAIIAAADLLCHAFKIIRRRLRCELGHT